MTLETHCPAASALMEVRNLSISFPGEMALVGGIDLFLHPGEVLCLVGESGSGKSLTALALMRLLPPSATVTADVLRLEGADILAASTSEMAGLRGGRIALILQDAALSLNPVMTIGAQITEALQTHIGVEDSAAKVAVLAMLDRVHLPGGIARFDLFPHQLSGGMRQRVLIAMALICRPSVLIADEPTSSLDALTQLQIVSLINNLCAELGSSVLMISHDLGLVQDVADSISVMYAGRIVEHGRRSDIFDNPMHPYTLYLLAAQSGGASLSAHAPAKHAAAFRGCQFHPRCPLATDKCRTEQPNLVQLHPGHSVACWRAPLERAES